MKSTGQKITSCFISLLMILNCLTFIKIPMPVNAYSYLSYGIDVSHARGKIDWDKVKAAGIDFAIIRSGYGKYDFQKDNYFDDNYSNAKRVGIKCGTYWYSYAVSVEDAYQEADVCYSIIKNCTFEYPVFFDLEDATISNSCSKQKITQIALAFCERMSSYGYDVGVYANTNWFTNYIDKNQIISGGYDIWQAHYPVKGGTVDPTQYDKSDICNMWQYSENGHIDGVNGYVDLDVSYTNYGKYPNDNTSRITISDQTTPTGNFEQGSNYGIYGKIISNLIITKVWGGIYKQGTDTTVQYVEDTPNATSYDLHGKFNNNLIFNNLSAGNYTYKIYAKDSQKTYTLINSDFSVGSVLNSAMSISGESIPSGTLTPGKFFAINGIVQSNLPITKIWGGVYKSDWTVTAQYAEATPNTTTYDLSKYFDSQIVFNVLDAGSYHYLIKATDSSGKEYTLINSEFQIGSVNTLEFSASSTTLNINKSKGQIKTITFSYKNAPVDRVSIHFIHGSNRITNCTWQEWSNHSIDLDFEGDKDGTEILTINLLNADNDAILASKTITVNVTSDPVEFSVSSTDVSMNRSKGEKKQVEFSYKNYDGKVSLSLEHGSNAITSCSWGEWTNNTIALTIEGLSDGTETITVYMEDSDSGNVISSKAVKVTVTSDELTVFFDANGGTCPASRKTVVYGKAYGVLPEAALGKDVFLGWFTVDGIEITSESIVELEEDIVLYARWKVQGDVNVDGVFDVQDIIMVQDWLLAKPDATLIDWHAADVCQDERIDVFDLCLLKGMLIERDDEKND